jgi:hypothetical protein
MNPMPATGHQPATAIAVHQRPTSGVIAAPMRISPERKSENKPRDTIKSSVSGLRNTLKVLDISNAHAT